VDAWLSSSLRRFYPASPMEDVRTLILEAARGERVSFQAVCRTGDGDQQIEASVSAPDALLTRVRRVGYVPLLHHSTKTPLDDLDGVGRIPGYVPDPLLPDLAFHAGPYETHAFWITVQVPADSESGSYVVTVTLGAGEERAALTAKVHVHQAVLPRRRDFPVTHWFYADALCDWYKVQPFEEAFWRVLDPYLADVAAHGQDTLYVPMFTPPLDGVKRPTQLLDVRLEDGRYQLDWSLVRRWIAAAQAHGIARLEWTHLFTQWGAQYAIRIYEGRAESETLLWPPETGATSEPYLGFLSQLLPEFERFLQVEGLMDRSFFHLSDEPHGDAHLASYQAARDLLHELAPWMRVMDALSDIRFARAGLTDVPIPITATAPDFVREGMPAWVYFCCGPRGRYLQRLYDTPLIKTRMAGWLFYRNQARGFLHWGYNYWYKRQTTQLIDPYLVSDGLSWPSLAYGDPFQVYPGPDGPVDSLRWEIFAESLQDYALLQASELAPNDPALADIRDYADFPRDAGWIRLRRAELLARLDRR